jgi:hypothetical protein
MTDPANDLRRLASTSTRTARLFATSLSLLCVVAAEGRAQASQENVGKITGRIVDASTGQGVVAAGIQVVGTTLGAQSGVHLA